MKKTLFLFAVLMLTICVSAFSQNYEQKKKELAQLCKTKVLAEDLDSYIRQSTASEIAVTVTNVTDNNIKEVERAINCSKKPISIVLSANKGFTKIPEGFLGLRIDTNYVLRNILLPSNLKSIGSSAFYNCANLRYVFFQGKGSSLESIGEDAFVNCINLRYLELPQSLKECDFSFLSDCWDLESITLPNWLTTIGARAFRGHSNLTSLEIPESVTYIGENAFSGCANLESIKIPKNVTYIGLQAFSGCSKITSITIPDGVKSIKNNTFKGCSNLTSIDIPNSVSEFGWGAFDGCANLTSIVIPEGIKEIENYTFSGCSSLKSITIPQSVETIGHNAFEGCSSLSKLEISNISNWGEYKYENGHLVSITIPKSATKNAHFKGCTGLTEVIFEDKDYKFVIAPFLECKSIQSVIVNGENVFAKYYKNDNGKIVENEKLPPISVHIENMNSDSTISKSNLKLLKEIGISTGDDEYDEYLKRHISVTIGLTIDGWGCEYDSKSTTLTQNQIDFLNKAAAKGSRYFYVDIIVERPEGIKKYITKKLKIIE